MITLSKAAERIATEAIARAFANGRLEILDAAGSVLAKFDLPDRHIFDVTEGKVRFAEPRPTIVDSMGDPARFRIVGGGDVSLVEGSAGPAESQPDLVVPAKRLFPGMRLKVPGVECKLRFGGRS